jgi:cephalosporin hydroxylase
VLDLWVIQETISELSPSLIIECGTNRGGSALFYAHLLDLIGSGEIITVDIRKLHELRHPRITFLVGSTTSREVYDRVAEVALRSNGPVMVILDSDHSHEHVLRELELYAPLVTPGSYCLVQDGVIDVLPCFKGDRPGPLGAIERFLKSHDEFEIDYFKCERFLITHHPKGWLRRKVIHNGPTLGVGSKLSS